MRNQEWDSALAQLYPLDFCQLVFRLFGCDSVDGKPALGIVDKTKILASLFNRYNVHEASRVGGIGPYFAVDFDKALHDDGFGLATVEGILQSREPVSHPIIICLYRNPGSSRDSPIPDEDNKWHAVSEFVGTWRWTGRVGTRQFVQKPMRWRTETLLVLLPAQERPY